MLKYESTGFPYKVIWQKNRIRATFNSFLVEEKFVPKGDKQAFFDAKCIEMGEELNKKMFGVTTSNFIPNFLFQQPKVETLISSSKIHCHHPKFGRIAYPINKVLKASEEGLLVEDIRGYTTVIQDPIYFIEPSLNYPIPYPEQGCGVRWAPNQDLKAEKATKRGVGLFENNKFMKGFEQEVPRVMTKEHLDSIDSMFEHLNFNKLEDLQLKAIREIIEHKEALIREALRSKGIEYLEPNNNNLKHFYEQHIERVVSSLGTEIYLLKNTGEPLLAFLPPTTGMVDKAGELEYSISVRYIQMFNIMHT